jgi:non-heme chloroperoxidase
MTQAATQHAIKSGEVTLHAREWGDPAAPPVVLIHGWSQSHLCWTPQYSSELTSDFRVIAFDNRGHGQSTKPMREAAYIDGKLWADDVAAVIETLALRKPVLVGWSYGGFIICDYVNHHGQSNLGGVNFVAASIVLAEDRKYLGADFFESGPAMMSPDSAVAIAGTRKFLRSCTHEPMPAEMWDTALCFNTQTPPEVRQWLASRRLDFTGVLRSFKVPTQVTIGLADRIVMPSMGEYIAANVPGAIASRYENVGHAPFIEDPARFNRELRELMGRVSR